MEESQNNINNISAVPTKNISSIPLTVSQTRTQVKSGGNPIILIIFLFVIILSGIRVINDFKSTSAVAMLGMIIFCIVLVVGILYLSLKSSRSKLKQVQKSKTGTRYAVVAFLYMRMQRPAPFGINYPGVVFSVYDDRIEFTNGVQSGRGSINLSLSINSIQSIEIGSLAFTGMKSLNQTTASFTSKKNVKYVTINYSRVNDASQMHKFVLGLENPEDIFKSLGLNSVNNTVPTQPISA